MKRVTETTLCCIDCINHEAAIRALRLSMSQCQFDKVIFLTDIDYSLDGIDVITIEKIRSGDAYSQFVLHDLIKYINTDYLLIIQWDGYILNGELWNESYKQFDYVGALWPWMSSEKQVGNGGFSFRSSKLLSALQDSRAQTTAPEDQAICCEFNRWLISDYAINYAPPNEAAFFSYERSRTKNKTFGFHGLFNMAENVASADWQGIFATLAEKSYANPEMLELSINLWKQGDFDNTKILLEKICAYFPKLFEAGYLLKKLNQSYRPDDAGRKFDGPKHEKFFNGDEILLEGLALQNNSDLKNALCLFKLASLINPDNPESFNLTGILMAQIGLLELSVKEFQHAVNLKKNEFTYHLNLGNAYFNQGNWEEAIKSFLMANNLSPCNPKIFSYLAEAYGENGQVIEAEYFNTKTTTVSH